MVLGYLKSIYWRMRYFILHEYTLQNLKIRRENRGKFRKFKNKYVGQRCFIIGNGPSLKVDDLNLLKNEITFAANRIFYMYSKTEWRPTFYCAQDKDVFEDISSNIEMIARESQACFFANYCKQYLINSLENTFFFHARLIGAHKKRKFSDDISKYVDGGGTITYAAIQLAAYMGFKEIYLLGVDHSYSAGSLKNGELNEEDVKKSYFEGMPYNIKITKPNTDNSTVSFIEAKNYAQKKHIKILNATRGGKLEVFERINFDEVEKK